MLASRQVNKAPALGFMASASVRLGTRVLALRQVSKAPALGFMASASARLGTRVDGLVQITIARALRRETKDPRWKLGEHIGLHAQTKEGGERESSRPI